MIFNRKIQTVRFHMHYKSNRTKWHYHTYMQTICFAFLFENWFVLKVFFPYLVGKKYSLRIIFFRNSLIVLLFPKMPDYYNNILKEEFTNSIHIVFNKEDSFIVKKTTLIRGHYRYVRMFYTQKRYLKWNINMHRNIF